MNPLLVGPIAELFNNLIGVGKELIVDKDKQIEFAFKIAELQAQLSEKMLTMQTTPKVDAFVKVLYAFKELILPMFRPLVSALPWMMLLWSPETVINTINLVSMKLGEPYSGMIITGLYSMFPAWGYSRHKEKNQPK
jgi:hypothetical protein